MCRRVMIAVVALYLVLGVARTSQALPEFKKAFDQRYCEEQDALKALAKKANCNICHVPKKPKTERNAYGDALANLIEGDANKRIKEARKTGGDEGKKKETQLVLEELEKAFEKAEEEKSEEGPTFGELLKEGKLPVTAKAEGGEEDQEEEGK